MISHFSASFVNPPKVPSETWFYLAIQVEVYRPELKTGLSQQVFEALLDHDLVQMILNRRFSSGAVQTFFPESISPGR